MPFFQGYLFAWLDPLRGEVRLASFNRGNAQVVGNAGEPWPAPATRTNSATGAPAGPQAR
jgi:hypothetical protein